MDNGRTDGQPENMMLPLIIVGGGIKHNDNHLKLFKLFKL